MTMRVMRIGNMGVRMLNRLVQVPVAVLAHRHHVVGVIVMPVIVAVRVFMLQRLMRVLVAV